MLQTNKKKKKVKRKNKLIFMTAEVPACNGHLINDQKNQKIFTHSLDKVS